MQDLNIGAELSTTTVATGIIVLPIAGGDIVVSYVLLTAMICASITMAVKLIKLLVVRG